MLELLKPRQIWSFSSEKCQLRLLVCPNYIQLKLSSSRQQSRIVNQRQNLKKKKSVSFFFFKYLPKYRKYSFSRKVFKPSVLACNVRINYLWYHSKFKDCLPFLFCQHFRQAIILPLLDYLSLKNSFHLGWGAKLTKWGGEFFHWGFIGTGLLP